MATYNVTLYKNTGFNSINIPDSPTLLSGMSSISVPALDINQERFLPNVRVRASWADVKDADYAKVGDFFYTINDIQMTSGDVADISLTPDFVTSAGGPGSLTILDGLTERVHVSDDTFGIYNGDDPFMNPSYDMDVVSSIHQFSDTSRTFVETTLDLYQMGEDYHNGSLSAWTAIDSISPPDPDGKQPAVTVPMARYLDDETEYLANLGGSPITLNNVKNQGIYEVGGTGTLDRYVTDGINVARSLGIEESISGQYSIPSDLITAGTISPFKGTMTGNGNVISGWSSNMNFIYGTANNNRVFYGNQTPYTLISSTGESITANAEEVVTAGYAFPRVSWVADPRRTGKPYFRFETLNGNNARHDFFRGCISGKQWDSVPMVLTEKSGSVLDRINYSASVKKMDIEDKYEDIQYQMNMIKGVVTATAGIAAAAAATATTGGAALSFLGIAGGSIGGIGSLINTQTNHDKYKETRYLERALEYQQFQISQNVNVPTILFPADPTLSTEFLHNGVVLCRNIYKPADITRIDKILTAFGYKHTKVLEASDFTNRTYFNYVKGSISVGGNLPRWWCNGIAEQIGGGVRVWHVKPNHSYYTSNPIRT